MSNVVSWFIVLVANMIITTENPDLSMIILTHYASFSYSLFICIVILCALLFSN